MRSSRRTQRSLMLLAGCAGTLFAAGAAFGQALEALSEKNVTSRALIERLRLDKTRTINVRPTGESAVSEPPSASLLITFRTSSTVLTGAARRALDVVATALKSTELGASQFRIEGHADPRGNAEANLRLSEGRAAEVRRYLVDVHRLPSGRLSSIGKGDRELMNSIDIAAPENRRVTIVNVSN